MSAQDSALVICIMGLQIALLYEAVTGQVPDYTRSPAAQQAAQQSPAALVPAAAPKPTLTVAASAPASGSSQVRYHEDCCASLWKAGPQSRQCPTPPRSYLTPSTHVKASSHDCGGAPAGGCEW